MYQIFLENLDTVRANAPGLWIFRKFDPPPPISPNLSSKFITYANQINISKVSHLSTIYGVEKFWVHQTHLIPSKHPLFFWRTYFMALIKLQ